MQNFTTSSPYQAESEVTSSRCHRNVAKPRRLPREELQARWKSGPRWCPTPTSMLRFKSYLLGVGIQISLLATLYDNYLTIFSFSYSFEVLVSALRAVMHYVSARATDILRVRQGHTTVRALPTSIPGHTSSLHRSIEACERRCSENQESEDRS